LLSKCEALSPITSTEEEGEAITIINIYIYIYIYLSIYLSIYIYTHTPKAGEPDFIKQTLLSIRADSPDIVTVSDLNILLSPIDQDQKKIEKDREL
jgi:hypothetical protein